MTKGGETGASPNLLDSRRGRFFTFCMLYISEGIPYGFTSIAMVSLMRREGLPLDQIGAFTAALFLPWAMKWAWAPLIDIVRLERFGGRRAWVVGCTSGMVITLAIVATIDFSQHFQLLVVMVIINNIFCATQDVAIDSLAVSTLREDERGRGNGFMFGGQYLGISLGGGAAVFVAGHTSFSTSLFYVMALMIANLIFILWFVRDEYQAKASHEAEGAASPLAQLTRSLYTFVVTVYNSFWRSGSGPKLGVLFAILPSGSMALAYATQSTIAVDYGLSDAEFATLSFYTTILSGCGCLFGGALSDRFGIKPTMAAFYLLTAAPTLTLASQIALVGLENIPRTIFFSLIMSHGFLFGMTFANRSALFMGMTNPLVAATQFTAFMAMSNLAISMGNYWQGLVGEYAGYATVLYLDAALMLVPLALIPFLSTRRLAESTF